MDQKSWLWKKRSAEKALTTEKANNSFTCNKEEQTEVQELLTEKAQVQRDIRMLNDKLSTPCECSSKDNIAKKQVKIAQEAIAGWEKAETEAILLKKDLDKVLQQKAASEERLSHLDAALKECMQQLCFVREEQEKRIHGAVVKKSEEFEKTRIALDEKLAHASIKLAKLDAENAELEKALSRKDKAIEELSKYKAEVEADCNALMLRVESIEKENSSLKYEVRVLEKELDIRNEETEFNRRTANVAQKQHQESVKKIAKLESDCQRLCLLVRKRLPGPSALTKMKNEVEMLGKDQVETRRRKSNPSFMSSMDFRVDGEADTPSKKINFLRQQLHAMEEENRSLKHALDKKSSELQFPRTMYPRTASRLSRGYGQVEESLKGQTNSEPRKYPFFLPETLSDLSSDSKASTCAESWASSFISELEHFKNDKQLGTPSNMYMGTPDMNLMDDFEEMEKLAVVSVNFPAKSSHHYSEEGNGRIIGLSGSQSGSPKPKPGSEIFPVRIDDLLRILLEHCQELQRDPHQVLEDIKVALEHNSSETVAFNGKASTNHPHVSDSPQVVFQTSTNTSLNLDTSDTGNDNNISITRKITQNLSTSIHKILELLEGINIISEDNGVTESSWNTNLTTPTGYMARVFQWRNAQLSGVLQQFVQTCNDLLNGTADVEQFVRLVASSLDWVMNSCFSLQDVSSMKDEIRNHLDFDESRSESEIYSGSANQSAESYRQRKDMSYLPLNGQNNSLHIEPNTEEEAKRLNAQQENKESSVMDLEGSKDIIDHLHPENDLENNNNNNNSSKRLGETSNDLKILQKCKTSKGVPVDDGNLWEKQLRNDWEITAASEKLAECQETIRNLGKQLKALTSPRDAAIFDKVISTPADSVITSMSTSHGNASRRLSLLDKMLAEDNNQTGASPKTKDDDIQNGNIDSAVSTNAATESWSKFTDPRDTDGKVVVSMAVVPRKKNGGTNLLKKLFWRQKKGKSKKTPLS